MSICHFPSPSPGGPRREDSAVRGMLGGCCALGLVGETGVSFGHRAGEVRVQVLCPSWLSSREVMETHTPSHSGGLDCVDTKAEGETELGYVDNIVPILECIASTLLLHIVWSLCSRRDLGVPQSTSACLSGSFCVYESHDFRLLKVVLKVSPATPTENITVRLCSGGLFNP